MSNPANYPLTLRIGDTETVSVTLPLLSLIHI